MKLGPKDSAEVKIQISLSEDIWEVFEKLPHEKEGRELYIRNNSLADIFGENWGSRIVNEQGDVCFIVANSAYLNISQGKKVC